MTTLAATIWCLYVVLTIICCYIVSGLGDPIVAPLIGLALGLVAPLIHYYLT